MKWSLLLSHFAFKSRYLSCEKNRGWMRKTHVTGKVKRVGSAVKQRQAWMHKITSIKKFACYLFQQLDSVIGAFIEASFMQTHFPQLKKWSKSLRPARNTSWWKAPAMYSVERRAEHDEGASFRFAFRRHNEIPSIQIAIWRKGRRVRRIAHERKDKSAMTTLQRQT